MCTCALFRGNFPADSKRGRICLLHDLRGDSDFEVDFPPIMQHLLIIQGGCTFAEITKN